MGNLEEFTLFDIKNGSYWISEDERLDYDGQFSFLMNYKIKDVLYMEQTPIQLITIVDTYTFGKTLTLDGGIQTTEKDGFIYNEMMAHVPLIIHPHAERVCVIGGGDGGVVSEVTKYSQVKQIDHIEIDEKVIQACRKFLPEIATNLDDPRIRFFYQDASQYIKETSEKYDVIIVDAADPMGPAKTLFTSEFLQDIAHALHDDGLMIIQSHPLFFHQEEARQVFQDTSNLFPITKMCSAVIPSYPGALQGFVLGSKKYHQLAIKNFNKDTKYVNQEILESCFAMPAFLQEFAPIIKR